jgi:hypothetical protein
VSILLQIGIKMKQKNILSIVTSLVTAIVLGACSGGGGSSSDPVTATTVTGQFIDAPVQGLGYLCSSGKRDKTNSNGEYICNVGDNVTFFIGSVNLGTVAAQSAAITPYTLFPNNVDAAINLARLLQSLDTDTADAVISVDTVLEANIPTTTDFTATSFETSMEAALGITLVSASEAQTSMNAAIIAVGGTVPTATETTPISTVPTVAPNSNFSSPPTPPAY